jgi:CRISPR/Cas system-associated exonuclease Cas4 (RecB family)
VAGGHDACAESSRNAENVRWARCKPMPSAGEVEQFAFCAHNWLLARQGVDPHVGSVRGMERHRSMGKEQTQAEHDRRESRYALQAALSVIMLALSGVLAAVALQLRGQVDVTALVVVAIVLALGSSSLLTLSLFAQRELNRRLRAARLVPGRVLSSDLAGEAPLLVDASWDLTGRPDYILRTRTGFVPVEVKTGRTPEKPYRSHRLQVASYLRRPGAGVRAPLLPRRRLPGRLDTGAAGRTEADAGPHGRGGARREGGPRPRAAEPLPRLRPARDVRPAAGVGRPAAVCSGSVRA